METFSWLDDPTTVQLSQRDRQLITDVNNRSNCCCNSINSSSDNTEVLDAIACLQSTLEYMQELNLASYRSLTAINPTVIFAEYPTVTDQGIIYHWEGIINQAVNTISVVFKGVIDTPNIPVFVTDKYNVPIPVLAIGTTTQLTTDDLQLNVLFPCTYNDVNIQLLSTTVLTKAKNK